MGNTIITGGSGTFMLIIDHDAETAFEITNESLTVIKGEDKIQEAIERQKEKQKRLFGITQEVDDE